MAITHGSPSATPSGAVIRTLTSEPSPAVRPFQSVENSPERGTSPFETILTEVICFSPSPTGVIENSATTGEKSIFSSVDEASITYAEGSNEPATYICSEGMVTVAPPAE